MAKTDIIGLISESVIETLSEDDNEIELGSGDVSFASSKSQGLPGASWSDENDDDELPIGGSSGEPIRQVTKELGEEFIKHFAELMKRKRHIDVPQNPKYLGTGSRGSTFELSGDKVIKITGDREEAVAANKLKDHKLKHVYTVFDVFRFKGFKVYGIIQEKLTPLEGADPNNPYRSETGEAGVFDWSVEVLTLYSAIQAAGYDFEELKVVIQENLYEKSKHTKDPKQLKKDFNTAWKCLTSIFSLKGMMTDLSSLGIKFHDYHAGNIMKRKDGSFVVIDIGYSRVAGGKEPEVLEKKKIAEAKADKIGITIGRFQPFHIGHADIIRKLAKNNSKVIVFVAGLKKDKKNPFSYDLRKELIRLSLPDIEDRIEVRKAEVDGKQNAFLPALIGRVVTETDSILGPDTVANILVGPDRYEDIKRQFESAADSELDGFDPTKFTVQKVEELSDDDGSRVSGTSIRDAIAADNKEAVKKLLDPHVSTDETKFNDLFEKMSAELSSKKESLVREFFEDIAPTKEKGLSLVRELVMAHADDFQTKGIDVTQLSELGYGRNGIAYDTGSGRILKVTTDKLEARNALSIVGHAARTVYQVFDVFAFPEKFKDDNMVYCIIHEKLQKLSDDEVAGIESALDNADYTQFNLQQMLSDADELGISLDLHPGNILKRDDNTYVVTDVGTAGDFKDLDESIRDAGGSDAIMSALMVSAEGIKKYFNVDVTKMKLLGHGQMGLAFDIGSGKILKATTDPAEAKASFKLVNRKLKHVVNVYKVYQLKNIGESKQPIFVIELEKLQELPEAEAQEFNDLCAELFSVDHSVNDRLRGPIMSLATGKLDEMIDKMYRIWSEEIRTELEYKVGSPINNKKEQKMVELLKKKHDWFMTTLKKFQLEEMVKDLLSVKIKFADYKAENIGKRGQEYVVFDIGVSQVEGTAVPPVMEDSSMERKPSGWSTARLAAPEDPLDEMALVISDMFFGA